MYSCGLIVVIKRICFDIGLTLLCYATSYLGLGEKANLLSFMSNSWRCVLITVGCRQRICRVQQHSWFRRIPLDGRDTAAFASTTLRLGPVDSQEADQTVYFASADLRVDIQLHALRSMVSRPAGQPGRHWEVRQHLAGPELSLERPTLRQSILFRLRESQCVNARRQ